MNKNIISILVQVSLGIIFTFVIYVLSLYVIKADEIVNGQNHYHSKKNEVKIIDGILNSSEKAGKVTNNTWNTTIPYQSNYLPITPSINTKGGAQFSYSFWLYIGNPSACLNKTLFLKGDKVPYLYTETIHNYDEDKTVYKSSDEQLINDRAIFCPSFSFGDSELEFQIKFNTFHNINEQLYIQRIKSENNTFRNNLQGLFPKTWFNITITFEDNIPINDFENGILVRFYINGHFYQLEKYASTLKQNKGNFYIFPDNEIIPDCKIADLSYFNYALSEEEVKALGNKQISTHKSASSTSKAHVTNTSLITDAKNYMDIYNV